MPNKGLSLASRRVVVIGGTSGIGFAVAELAVGLGADVVIASSNADRVAAAVTQLPGTTGQIVDLRDQNSVAGFFKGLDGLDHLAITAGDWGGSMFAATADVDLALARDGIEVRLWGVLAAAKHATGTMSANGSITLTSGIMADRPQKGAPLAAMLGGAVAHLAAGLAVDLAPVRVNAVSPGLVLTGHVLQAMPAEMRQAFVAGLPLARAAQPEEAATAYIYAMLNDYLTGQTLPVDGGGLLV